MRTTVNIPDEDLEAFDSVWQEEGIDSRSRAVREAIQEYVESHARLEDLAGDVVALVAFDYEHHEVIEALHGVQHDYQDVIDTTSHTHQGEWSSRPCSVAGPPNACARWCTTSGTSTASAA